MTWTLKNGTTEKSLAEWGIDGSLSLSTGNFQPDQLTFSVPKQASDLIELTSRKIELRRNGSTIFMGRLDTWTDDISTNEAYRYNASGPWWYLDNIIYEQRFRTADDTDSDGALLSNVVVGIGGFGRPLTMREALVDVFEFVSSLGIPVRLGQISSDFDDLFPPFAASGISCAEVIRRILATRPFAVGWWDYRDSVPTWHVYPHAQLPVYDLQFGEPPLTSVRLHRSRTRPHGIDLKYIYAIDTAGRRQNASTATGDIRRRVITDSYPEASLPADRVRRLSVTVDLSSEPAAEPPVGLAKSYFESIPEVLWSGEITLTDHDVSGPWLGRRIRLLGGQSRYTDYPCLVQSATYNIHSGTVSLQIGANTSLAPETFLAQQRALRRAILGTDTITTASTLTTAKDSIKL